MSRNLVEIVRRRHEVGAPTALEVLKEAMERCGETTDEDRRVAAERSGLPEAAVHGVSTFYDDLLQPRGARHVRVCTGTARFAATGGAHVDALREGLGGLELGQRRDDGAVSLAQTVCLGFCHASPAIREGDVIDAGPGVVGHVFTTFHFPEIRTNRLIGSSVDVNTSCPEYKVVAVDVRPVAEQASRPPAIAPAS